ncbi:MAG: hypothetical protein ACI9OD_001678 [Limisphaerales bacterium]|jgi:hypothetical protein
MKKRKTLKKSILEQPTKRKKAEFATYGRELSHVEQCVMGARSLTRNSYRFRQIGEVEISDKIDRVLRWVRAHLEEILWNAILEEDTPTIEQIATATALPLVPVDEDRANLICLSMHDEKFGLGARKLRDFAQLLDKDIEDANLRKMLKELEIPCAKERTGRPKKEE